MAETAFEIALSQPTVDRIQRLIEGHPELGILSVSHFINAAVLSFLAYKETQTSDPWDEEEKASRGVAP